MGETAENVAERYGISRADQDALAVEGHRRAAQAIAEGRFKKQIVPIESNVRGATVTFDTDEHVRENASLEDMAKLRPAFRKEGRSEEHTSELQSLMRISYAVFCLKKKKKQLQSEQQ